MNGAPEIPLDGLVDEHPILDVDRPIQPHVVPEPLHLGDGGIRRQQERNRVAREAHDDEDHRHHAPERDQQAKQPVDQEPPKPLHEHLAARRRPGEK